MSNNNYYITEKGYKRQKCSLYLQQKVYEKLIEISEKNELSISELWTTTNGSIYGVDLMR